MHLFFVEDGAGVYDSVQLGVNSSEMNPHSFPQVFYSEGNQVWGAVRFGSVTGAVSSVTSDATAAYNIIARVSADAAASYSILAAIAADAVASYTILSAGAVQSDCAASYVIRAAVTADCVASYSIGAGAMPTAADIAARVRVELASELAYIMDLSKIHGLVLGTNLVATPSSRTAGTVVQTISGDGITNTTISRVP